jgi:hypothetical protein
VNVSTAPVLVNVILPKIPSENYVGQPEPLPPAPPSGVYTPGSGTYPSGPSGTYPSSGISTGYTPNPELREVAKQTLSNWYQNIPSFFNLIFLLFFMATLTRVMPRRRR